MIKKFAQNGKVNFDACAEVIRLLEGSYPSQEQVDQSVVELEDLKQSQDSPIDGLTDFFMHKSKDHKIAFNCTTGFQIQYALVSEFKDGLIPDTRLDEQDYSLPYLYLLYAFFCGKYNAPHHPVPISGVDEMKGRLKTKCRYLFGKKPEAELLNGIGSCVDLFCSQGIFVTAATSLDMYVKLLGDLNRNLVKPDGKGLLRVVAYRDRNKIKIGTVELKKKLVEGIACIDKLGDVDGGTLKVNKHGNFEITTTSATSRTSRSQTNQAGGQPNKKEYEHIDRLCANLMRFGDEKVGQIREYCLSLCQLAWLNNITHQNDPIENPDAHMIWNDYYQLAFSLMALLYCIDSKLNRPMRPSTSINPNGTPAVD